jgi:ligand-binding SRPBCC domain-containing protein
MRLAMSGGPLRFRSEIWLPGSREDVFRFFSDAGNLQQITPPWLHFRILTPTPAPVTRGTLIDYRLRLHGIPLRWQSEITSWDPPNRFVDEQRRGPYRRWVHTHEFVDERGGTKVRDLVEYGLPFPLVSARFVRRDIEKIFAYRSQVLAERFGPAPNQ